MNCGGVVEHVVSGSMLHVLCPVCRETGKDELWWRCRACGIGLHAACTEVSRPKDLVSCVACEKTTCAQYAVKLGKMNCGGVVEHVVSGSMLHVLKCCRACGIGLHAACTEVSRPKDLVSCVACEKTLVDITHLYDRN
ncbi:hypothetical protein QE152_g39877 [Popillia japonica]|uniref:Phorbol-ester/DAG-type domain-containing protein n=1 Tax=Popillia japonica TaxID=7064 RepID=A0AAW1HT36_POPJA